MKLSTVTCLLIIVSSRILLAQTCNSAVAVYGPTNACLGNSYTYSVNAPLTVIWTISSGGTIVSSPPNANYKIIKWMTAGPQTIILKCGSYSNQLNVNVVNSTTPPSPSTISGPTTVCTSQVSTTQ